MPPAARHGHTSRCLVIEPLTRRAGQPGLRGLGKIGFCWFAVPGDAEQMWPEPVRQSFAQLLVAPVGPEIRAFQPPEQGNPCPQLRGRAVPRQALQATSANLLEQRLRNGLGRRIGEGFFVQNQCAQSPLPYRLYAVKSAVPDYLLHGGNALLKELLNVLTIDRRSEKDARIALCPFNCRNRQPVGSGQGIFRRQEGPTAAGHPEAAAALLTALGEALGIGKSQEASRPLAARAWRLHLKPPLPLARGSSASLQNGLPHVTRILLRRGQQLEAHPEIGIACVSKQVALGKKCGKVARKPAIAAFGGQQHVCQDRKSVV